MSGPNSPQKIPSILQSLYYLLRVFQIAVLVIVVIVGWLAERGFRDIYWRESSPVPVAGQAWESTQYQIVNESLLPSPQLTFGFTVGVSEHEVCIANNIKNPNELLSDPNNILLIDTCMKYGCDKKLAKHHQNGDTEIEVVLERLKRHSDTFVSLYWEKYPPRKIARTDVHLFSGTQQGSINYKEYPHESKRKWWAKIDWLSTAIVVAIVIGIMSILCPRLRRLRAAVKNIDALARTLDSTEQSLRNTEGELTERQAELGKTQAKLGKTQSELRGTQAKLRGTEGELGKSRGKLDQKEDELREVKTKLTTTEIILENTRDELRRQEELRFIDKKAYAAYSARIGEDKEILPLPETPLPFEEDVAKEYQQKTQEEPRGNLFSDKLNIPIADLHLSLGVTKCLESINVEFLGQLVQLTEADLLKTPGFGKKSLREVKRKLADMDLSLRMTDDT